MENRSEIADEILVNARELARTVVERRFGSSPTEITEPGGGESNIVFEVQHPEGEFIVRVGMEDSKFETFDRERWACECVSKTGVPVPVVLEVGDRNSPLPYIMLHKIEGFAAISLTDRAPVLRSLGQFAALINSIETEGFGYRFQRSRGESAVKSWAEYLNDEFRLDAKLDLMQRNHLLSSAQVARIESTLRGLSNRRRPFLNHGDLRLKNVLVDDVGRIAAIIDWEKCTSNIAPEWELSLALHDLSIDEKEDFLAGYGISTSALLEMAPVMKAFNLINYAPEIERLIESGDDHGIDRLRARLNGALDLYAL